MLWKRKEEEEEDGSLVRLAIETGEELGEGGRVGRPEGKKNIQEFLLVHGLEDRTVLDLTDSIFEKLLWFRGGQQTQHLSHWSQ